MWCCCSIQNSVVVATVLVRKQARYLQLSILRSVECLLCVEHRPTGNGHVRKDNGMVYSKKHAWGHMQSA